MWTETWGDVVLDIHITIRIEMSLKKGQVKSIKNQQARMKRLMRVEEAKEICHEHVEVCTCIMKTKIFITVAKEPYKTTHRLEEYVLQCSISCVPSTSAYLLKIT